MCENNTSSNNNRVTTEEVKVLAKLCCSSKNVEVTNFTLHRFAKNLGYLGVHELLQLEIDEHDPKSRKKLTFFVKSLASSGNDFDQLSFRDESFFFKIIVPQLLENFQSEPWAAKCYIVNENALVLEDLSAQGFKVIDGQLDLNHIKSASMALARFHASSIILETKLGTKLNVAYPNSFESKNFVTELSWKWTLAGIEVAEAIAHTLNLNAKYIRPAYDLMIAKVKSREERTNVLCHCDLWLNNIMFNETSPINCRFVDFQMISYLPYALDVSQLIYLNLTGDVRKKIEKEVLKTYHSSLCETLRIHGVDKTKLISLQEVIEDFENMRITALVTAVQFWPISLLNEEMSKEYSHDVDQMESYKYISRKDFVFRVMQLDSNYRIRMEGIVRDLIEYMEDHYKGSI